MRTEGGLDSQGTQPCPLREGIPQPWDAASVLHLSGLSLKTLFFLQQQQQLIVGSGGWLAHFPSLRVSMAPEGIGFNY